MKALNLALLLTLIFLSSSPAQEARFFRVAGPVESSITAFSADGYITWTNELTNATFTVQTAQTLVGPSNWVDYIKVPVTNAATTHRLYHPNPPTNMVLIPAGSFIMGNCMDTNEGSTTELPLHTVYVSAFYMEKYEVTKALWDEVYQWATNHDYRFDNRGSWAVFDRSKGESHPVHWINWYDCVKWCNARSQKVGLTPCYYTDAALTNTYKTGRISPYAKWEANGYRLPTEAEWEKAARGGASGHRFPWSDSDDITHERANYNVRQQDGTNYYTYDKSVTVSYHPTFNDGVKPYTSPVGYFAANGYGLYDMAGNVEEWCWDWYSSTYYSSSPGTDPRGAATGLERVLRGGRWWYNALQCRSADRDYLGPVSADDEYGFRCVRGL